MHSFISNFKKTNRALLSFFIISTVLFTLYILSIEVVRPKAEEGLSQRQDNMIKIENFLFDKEKIRGVILGTSLSARIKLPGFINLGLAGESLRTGLALLEKSNAHRNITVLVETNFLSESQNKNLLETVFSFPQHSLKSFSLAFQERAQPTTLAKAWLKKIMKKGNPKDVFIPEIYEMMLPNILKNFKNLPKDNLRNKYPQYFQAIETLKSHAQVIAFRLPMSQAVLNVTNVKEYYTAAEVSLNEMGITTISPPEDLEFQTTDGIHLTTDSRKKYEHWLLEKHSELF